jgi:hypothetical protein
LTAAERQRANVLLKALRASLMEQATVWRQISSTFETAYHRKPTQRDIEMEVRLKMKLEQPEVIRTELAILGVDMRHE